MPGFFSALADLLGIPPIPGTVKYRDALNRCMKQRNEELDKPAEQRDAARLLELTKRVLRMRIAMFQAFAHLLRSNAGVVARSPNLGCCRDCMRVRQRVAAALRARAAWHNAWALISTLRLEAMEQGHPKPPLVLPYLDVQPHLAEGVPEELPASSIDRCAACQKELQEHLYLERHLLVQVDFDP